MLPKLYLLPSFLLLSAVSLPAQAPMVIQKEMMALRSTASIRLDGVLDEMAWQNPSPISGFIQNQPHPGISASFPSEIRVLYDDVALYVGAMLYDTNPDSILRQMSARDEFANTDWFAVFIDAYHDGNNGFGFAVTPAGIQKDLKFAASYSSGNGFGDILSAGDSSWDAVWDAAVSVQSNGWVVEMKIPYSAIRFPSQPEQIWGVNFAREVRRYREVSFWNEINPDIQGYLNQFGKLRGITDIKPPVRLSATPFLAVYAENNYDKNRDPKSLWGRSINGGMDVKYGLNDAFTLDMTLVPDFGQVRSDNEVLNLSPFEVRFDENRQFFTEGTELFTKGGLFYSRRVGGRPLHFFDVYDKVNFNEEVADNPIESQLYNASKLSGRTTGGLGIGLFNAISAPTAATVRNVETGETRKVQTDPLTNYNILVFDQNLPNNSYLALINTNVWRSGSDYEANVTGTRFQVRNKAQSFAFDGKAAVSQKYFPNETVLGHSLWANVGRTSGVFQWEIGYSQESEKYDPNDLGFLYSPNEKAASTYASLNKNQPFGKFLEAHLNFGAEYGRLYQPDAFTNFGFGPEGWMLLRSRFAFGMYAWISPLENRDYFEVRTSDFSRYYALPAHARIGSWISTDFRKKLAMDVNASYHFFEGDGRYEGSVDFGPRYRVNDRLSIRMQLSSFRSINDVGYVAGLSDGDIIFGVRDNVSFSALLQASYIFTSNMSLNLRVRHYWSKAEYKEFKLLLPDGSLGETPFSDFSDSSFDAFTVDASYRWRFAPGSDIFIVWKNNTAGFANTPDEVMYNYRDGLRGLNDFPRSNSLSLKVIYYIDYLYFKGKA